jgi:hypothetical protein
MSELTDEEKVRKFCEEHNLDITEFINEDE